jgi:spore maturation protein CgeB
MRSTPDSTRGARICLPTARRFSRMAFQCGHLEAQDVLAEVDDVDLVCLEAEPGFQKRQQWIRRLMYHDVTRRLAFMNPGLRRVKLQKDYDLLVVMCQTYWDFLNINAIENWKDRVRTSVCWIDELWAARLPLYKYWLPSLSRFDHVIVGMRGTVEPLSDAIGRRCHYVPAGVDALRFSPSPHWPNRVIDVYSIGRKSKGIHEALLEEAARRRMFYLYDTLQSGESHASDHREHRNLYANTAKRSRFFIVAPGKADVPRETQGQIEVGFRYYEGAAAGTVMVGQAPDCPQFRELFDWPDAVVGVRPDGSDVAAVLSRLTRERHRAEEIRRRNARGALLRHDWSYRWAQILDIAKLQPHPAMQGRRQLLADRAQQTITEVA